MEIVTDKTLAIVMGRLCIDLLCPVAGTQLQTNDGTINWFIGLQLGCGLTTAPLNNFNYTYICAESTQLMMGTIATITYELHVSMEVKHRCIGTEAMGSYIILWPMKSLLNVVLQQFAEL